MKRYYVLGFTKTGMYSVLIEATGPVGALLAGKREIRALATTTIRRWSVQLAGGPVGALLA